MKMDSSRNPSFPSQSKMGKEEKHKQLSGSSRSGPDHSSTRSRSSGRLACSLNDLHGRDDHSNNNPRANRSSRSSRRVVPSTQRERSDPQSKITSNQDRRRNSRHDREHRQERRLSLSYNDRLDYIPGSNNNDDAQDSCRKLDSRRFASPASALRFNPDTHKTEKDTPRHIQTEGKDTTNNRTSKNIADGIEDKDKEIYNRVDRILDKLAQLNFENTHKSNNNSHLRNIHRSKPILRKKSSLGTHVTCATQATFDAEESTCTNGSKDDDLGSLLDASSKSEVIEEKDVDSNTTKNAGKKSLGIKAKSKFAIFMKKAEQDLLHCSAPKSPIAPKNAMIPSNKALKANNPTSTETGLPHPPPTLKKSSTLPTDRTDAANVPAAAAATTTVNSDAIHPPPPPPLIGRSIYRRRSMSTGANLSKNNTALLKSSSKKNHPPPPPPRRCHQNIKSAPTSPISSPHGPLKPSITSIPDTLSPISSKLFNKNTHRRQKHVTNMPYTDQFNDFGFYSGEVDEDSRPHGQGICKFENGIFYEGKWKNGNQDCPSFGGNSGIMVQRERMLSGFTSWRGQQAKTREGGDGCCHVYGMDWIDCAGLAGKYTGKVNAKNVPSGRGIMRYNMGLVAEGEWINGLLDNGSSFGHAMMAMTGGATVVPDGTVVGGGGCMSVMGGGVGMGFAPSTMMSVCGGSIAAGNPVLAPVFQQHQHWQQWQQAQNLILKRGSASSEDVPASVVFC